jgi:ABC-type transport system involved in cytochrome c biogenesis permease subunit
MQFKNQKSTWASSMPTAVAADARRDELARGHRRLAFLTVGLVVGALWTAQARLAAPDDPNLQAMALDDPKIFVAVFMWAVYSFAILARQTMGWSGRRSARLSAFGFGIMLLNFLPINYFITTSHTF